MFLPTPHDLLHAPKYRTPWRWMWAGLIVLAGLAGLTPGDHAPAMTPSDKLDHLLGFTALSVAGLFSMATGWRNATATAASMLAYGALIELLQTQVPGRYGDMQDMLADALGVGLGLALAGCLRWRFRQARY